MSPFETYQTYLSLKSHFTNSNYDFFKYKGKSRATVTSFNRRKDKYFFEKSSRKYSDKEIVDFFLSNFISTDNPQNLWIGEIINSGERVYSDWMKRQQSLSYLFTEESNELFSELKLKNAFDCSKGHPPVLKAFLGGRLSPENLVIYDKIFEFCEIFDQKLKDPIWESVSLKIKKYKSFMLHIDVLKFKKLLREIINE